MAAPSRRGRPGVAGWSAALAAVIAGLLVGLGAPAAATASVTAAPPAPRCQSAPPTAPVIADIPWPQARYDLTAIGQITQGAGALVAVVDSGVDATNPQLAGGAVQGGGDLLDATGDGRDDCVGHGTAVASIIAARPVDGAGLRGLAPASKILAVRVSERIATENGVTGTGDVGELIAGIRQAVRHNPKPQVINLSISTTTDNADLRAAIQSALDADIVVVAAVGNEFQRGNPQPYPASYDGVVGVGAIGPTGERVALSQVGSYVDLVAPGDAVVGAAPHGGHIAYQGTSFAAPFVAATAALIRSRWPELNRTEVVRRLLATADPAAGGRPSADYGYGVVNPLRALTELLPPEAAAPVASPSPIIPAGLAATDERSAPTVLAWATAAVLLLATAAIAAVAAAVPLGRRRGWRP
jgi:type VII secretion-associated serine protease mycosin